MGRSGIEPSPVSRSGRSGSVSRGGMRRISGVVADGYGEMAALKPAEDVKKCMASNYAR